MVGDELLSEEQASMVQRFDPGADGYDTAGFFIAKFVKTESYV